LGKGLTKIELIKVG